MNELLTALTQHELVSGQYILLDRNAEGFPVQVVEIADFDRMFGNAMAEEDVYRALVAADDNGDGSTKGYKRFFDAWRDAGVLQPPPAGEI